VPATAGSVLALVDSSVVDVGSGTFLRGQTIVVRAGRIESVSAEPAPSDATVISATGKFIVPGLIDMQVHMRESDLAAYVEAGITSVRHMWGVPGMLELGARVVERNELGPNHLRGQPWRGRSRLALAVHRADRRSRGRGCPDRPAGRGRLEVDQGLSASPA